jgi:diaminopimelate decarboxylase
MLRLAEQHEWLQPVSLAAHIGSQITKLPPFAESAKFLVDLTEELAEMNIPISYLDVGGGLGIEYDVQNTTPGIAEWVTAVSDPISQAGYDLVLEPGRAIIGPTGLLLTRVIYTKRQGDKLFVITDAGMNDLIRPTLYQAHHPILPVRQPVTSDQQSVDIVGPICETGDYLAKERPFPPVQPGDLIAVMQAGAYGFAMASNYNGRLRPAEVLVYKDQYRIIRQRQKPEHLVDGCIDVPVWEK